MALFPPSCVLRGFSGCGVLLVRLAGAALLDEKIAHFWISLLSTVFLPEIGV